MFISIQLRSDQRQTISKAGLSLVSTKSLFMGAAWAPVLP